MHSPVQQENAITCFLEIYGKDEVRPRLYFAPGRVNLIGEHTDYNDGFVLPCALNYGTYLVVRPSLDGRHHFHSANQPGNASLAVSGNYGILPERWINYPLGVIQAFQEKGFDVPPVACFFSGDIPNSAGLSSSASIEIVTAFAVNDLFGFGLSGIDLVQLSRKAENEFVGVSCGIMDQFAVGMGKKDHAIFLNCGTLNYNLVPMNLGDYRLVIMNTGKVRGLADSKYNERVGECRAAITAMEPSTGFRSLGAMNTGDLESHGHLIIDPVAFRRARHVVSENRRVLEAVKALWNEDLEQFGQLMVASHVSLRDDYEVTGTELDTIVELALDQQGILGARMTGAGFGGCAIALVKQEKTSEFVFNVKSKYKTLINLEPEFYLPDIGNGVQRIN
jgi:galactokinase